jgi:hypothetical protein
MAIALSPEIRELMDHTNLAVIEPFVSQSQYASSNNGDVCSLHPSRVAALLYLRISDL